MTNRTNRKVFLKALRRGLADFAYGINAGSAIRHGLPVPPRRAAQPLPFEDPVLVLPLALAARRPAHHRRAPRTAGSAAPSTPAC
jgi:hypothetical protein